jgi:hypothetical protein
VGGVVVGGGELTSFCLLHRREDRRDREKGRDLYMIKKIMVGMHGCWGIGVLEWTRMCCDDAFHSFV